MTDKQIIIDGVDVSECDELVKQDDNTLICEITGYLCEDRQNCYYKQLKRKEQECETLASQLDFEVQKKECLEQECEKLKKNIANQAKIIYELKNEFKKTKIFNNEIKKSKNELFDTWKRQLDKLNKYEQTLTEIKEIAENCCINQATLDCENYDDCTQCGRISDGEGIQQILQKISEVEE